MQANWSYHFIVTHILIKIYVTQPNDPPYSQDLGHFQKIKSSLERQRFATIEDIQKNVLQPVKAIQRSSKNILDNDNVIAISIYPTEMTEKETSFHNKLWNILKVNLIIFKIFTWALP